MKTSFLLLLSLLCLAQSIRTDINAAQELISRKASTSACYCARTKTFEAAFFKSKEHEVWGTTHGLRREIFGKAQSGIYYYVEVRHIVQGEGDDSYSIMRSCNHENCNKGTFSSARGHNGTDVMAFLLEHKDQLRTEAYAKMRVTNAAHQGWSGIVAGKDQLGIPVIPTILNTGEPGVVVAVYWTTEYGEGDIASRLAGWGARFEPKDTQLAWGFEEVLNSPQDTIVDITPEIGAQTASVPKGMVLDSKDEYTSLPSK